VRWVPNLRQVIQKLAALFRQSSITLLPENRQQRQRKTTMYDTYGELYTGEGGEKRKRKRRRRRGRRRGRSSCCCCWCY